MRPCRAIPRRTVPRRRERLETSLFIINAAHRRCRPLFGDDVPGPIIRPHHNAPVRIRFRNDPTERIIRIPSDRSSRRVGINDSLRQVSVPVIRISGHRHPFIRFQSLLALKHN